MCELLLHLGILFNVLSMQANTRPQLKALTVLQRETHMEMNVLGIRERGRKIDQSNLRDSLLQEANPEGARIPMANTRHPLKSTQTEPMLYL